jgi:glyoxylase-like metal-dependent hydrolase (beta-lactamase superfamily II)
MELGPMQNFVYLIGDPETRECVVVDPAWEIDAIVDQVERDGMKLRGALVTHTHQDHVGGHLFGFDIPGVEELLARVPVKVYVHKAEREFLRGFGSDLVKVDGGDTVSVGPGDRELHPHARPHAGLPVLPRRWTPGLGGHALHPLVRANRSAG